MGNPVRPATRGTLEGAGVGLLDMTLKETTEIRLASPGGLDPLATVDATEGSTLDAGTPPAAWAELVPSLELDGRSVGDLLGSPLAAPEGRAGAKLANEALLAVGILTAELVACAALE